LKEADRFFLTGLGNRLQEMVDSGKGYIDMKVYPDAGATLFSELITLNTILLKYAPKKCIPHGKFIYHPSESRTINKRTTSSKHTEITFTCDLCNHTGKIIAQSPDIWEFENDGTTEEDCECCVKRDPKLEELVSQLLAVSNKLSETTSTSTKPNSVSTEISDDLYE
jgi:hypothetical protein